MSATDADGLQIVATLVDKLRHRGLSVEDDNESANSNEADCLLPTLH